MVSPTTSSTKVGAYELLDKIGKGSMGTVYRARHCGTKELVAIKMVTEEVAANAVLIQRFDREAQATRALQHPNLIRVLDTGKSNEGLPYLVMEYVEGESLGQYLDRQGPMPEAQAVALILQVGDALHLVHQSGFIHRDVKPDNILLSRQGQAKLGDFGLVKNVTSEASLTRSGKAMGTPNFMAPEQFEDAKRVDHRSDIYALAATFYTAVTGEMPFRGRSQLGILKKKLHNEFAAPSELAPSLSSAADRAIRKALDAQPERRQASVREFLQDLTGQDIGAGQGSLNLPVGLATPIKVERRGVERHFCDLDLHCRPYPSSTDIAWPARAFSISTRGIGICLKRPVEAGTSLFVQESAVDGTMAVIALVRWVEACPNGTWKLGCSFHRPLADADVKAMRSTRLGSDTRILG